MLSHDFAYVTHFCMHNCGVRKKLFTPLIKKVADHGLLLIAPTALEATLRLRPKFHRFDLLLYLLQRRLYNI